MQPVAQKDAGHGELVVGTEPAVDMDRGDLGDAAFVFEQRDDLVDGGMRQRRHVLAEVDGEVSFAVELVGGNGGAGHLGQNALAECGQLAAVGGAFGFACDKFANHLAGNRVVSEIERAIFADHAGHRPEARNHVAPASRPAGDRDDGQAGAVKSFKRGIGSGGELAVGGQRIVDIGEDADDATGGFFREIGNRRHRAAPSVKDARRLFQSASLGQSSAWMARNSA